MATTELKPEAEEEAMVLSAKARERDLLAIIAAKDKRIQQLEEKLELQNKFADSIIKLSDDFKIATNRGRRRVSWCASVDEQEDPLTWSKKSTSDHTSSSYKQHFEFSVEDILDDDDSDISVLSGGGEDESEKKPEAAAPSDKKAEAAPTTSSKAAPAVNSMAAPLTSVVPAKSSSTKSALAPASPPRKPTSFVAAFRPKSATPAASTAESKKTETAEQRRKRRQKKKESSIVQSIIQGLRTDDDSVSC